MIKRQFFGAELDGTETELTVLAIDMSDQALDFLSQSLVGAHVCTRWNG